MPARAPERWTKHAPNASFSRARGQVAARASLSPRGRCRGRRGRSPCILRRHCSSCIPDRSATCDRSHVARPPRRWRHLYHPHRGHDHLPNGPEIIDRTGRIVWFHAIPADQTAADFRVQTYHGKKVLTWWQGTGLGGLSSGTDYIYNQNYQPIATVNAGNGLSADGHEFLITPWNTALILSYTTATADLTSIGGPADQTVINGVVQEIDIATGKVLFQWNSEDHVPFSDSEQPLPSSAATPWDWFHINAVHLNTNGDLLIDARDTWTTYDVNPVSGKINWELGGKQSSFTLAPPRDRYSTARASSSPGSTIPRRLATTSTPSSTTSPPVRPSSHTAAQ